MHIALLQRALSKEVRHCLLQTISAECRRVKTYLSRWVTEALIGKTVLASLSPKLTPGASISASFLLKLAGLLARFTMGKNASPSLNTYRQLNFNTSP